MIVLHLTVRSSNHTWKPFVTNGVTEILKLIGGCRLAAEEIEEALLVLLKFTQNQFFSADRGFKSQMKTLITFIDESGFIRISGQKISERSQYFWKCWSRE